MSTACSWDSPHERAWHEALAGFADPARFPTAFYEAYVAGESGATVHHYLAMPLRRDRQPGIKHVSPRRQGNRKQRRQIGLAWQDCARLRQRGGQ
jgi:hypothetical protein